MYFPEGKRVALSDAARFFSSVPFADFGVLSGSCASGNARADSDIDIIVGCRPGRVWTARFFTLLFADARGIRHKNGGSENKLCLSLFVSPGYCRMNDPENDYERALYPELRPFFGDSVSAFYKENRGLVADDFMEREELWLRERKTFIALAIEGVLRESFGDRVEAFLRKRQAARIEHYVASMTSGTPKKRVVLSEGRVETHFRIDQ